MRASGNGSPEVCAANLLRIVRGEVAYDRGMIVNIIQRKEDEDA